MSFLGRIHDAVQAHFKGDVKGLTETAVRAAVVAGLDEVVRQIPALATLGDGKATVVVRIPAQELRIEIAVE